MVMLNRNEKDRLLELGGGANPTVRPECTGGNDVHLDSRYCQNEQGQQVVDIQWDLNQLPLPLGSNEFDGTISVFALEHISWRVIPQLLAECLRVLKPGKQLVLVLPNTRAQMQWIIEHHGGWDGKGLFESASCVLYGDQDYPENSHRSYWTPEIAIELLSNVGFENVVVHPYGDRATDICVRAAKPEGGSAPVETPAKADEWETCNAEGPNGVRCTLIKGHEGKHRAETK